MTKLKTIVVFIDWFLPGFKAGGPITSVANMIDFLKDEFKFLIITSDTDYLESQPYKNIESNKWINFDTNVKVFYFSKENLNRKNIKKLISETDFDIAYINGIYSYYFSILPLIVNKKMSKKVLVNSRGMLSEHSFSRKKIKKRIYIIIAKFFRLYRNIYFHTTNIQEKKDIEHFFSKKEILVIPNLPRKIDNFELFSKEKTSNELLLVSIARISQEKNTLFALETLSFIKNKKIIFDIYGSIYDYSYWNKCKSIIEKLPPNISVNYKGNVDTAKVISTFSKYHFSFMPSLGENFGHSILESMIAGTPVIISDNTFWRNLQSFSAGWDLNLKNRKEFIQVIEHATLYNQKQYDELSLKTFKYAKAFMKDEKIKKMYICMFNEL